MSNDYVPDEETIKTLEKFFEDILTVLSKIAPGQSKIRGEYINKFFYHLK